MKSGSVIKLENLPVQIALGPNYQQENRQSNAMNSDSSQPAAVSNFSAAFKRNRSTETQLKPWQLEEKQTIEKILIRHKGNRIKAAAELGISRSTLWRKMTMYRLAL